MKSINLCRQFPKYVALLLLVSSCTVYTPMQPTVSTIRTQGETELATSLQPKGRLEASVVHSPLPHLLVSAAGSFRPKFGDSTYAATRQWEAGVGTYWALGPRWTITALIGGGQAYVNKAFKPLDILSGPSSRIEYQARYHKLFGQLGLTRQVHNQTFGAVYRLADIRFSQLEYLPAYSAQYVNLANRDMMRHELLLFQRFSLDQRQRWQFQLSGGLSVDMQARNTGDIPEDVYQDNRTARPVLLASAGVVFRPALLRKKQLVQP